MRFSASGFLILRLLALAGASSCGDDSWPRPANVSRDRFLRDFQEWRDERRARLVAPGSGPVTWVGLWELPQGRSTLGADTSLAIRLPPLLAPAIVGSLYRTAAQLRFEPAPRANVRLADGSPVASSLTLKNDRADSATVLAIGTLRLRIHGEPGTERLWLRAWDEAHPARATFTLPDTYRPDTTWRLAARFEPYDEAREYRVADVVGGTQGHRAPGDLVFRIGRTTHRLAAFADAGAKSFFIMFWDSTATGTTYEGGRYLRADLPDSTGWTVIDFNRAYNPPCVFTPYSTCALPPRENRLLLTVTAGEKRLP